VEKSLKIMKFGGSSVGTAEAIRQVAELVASEPEVARVLVVSAQQGMTDRLLQLATAPDDLPSLQHHIEAISSALKLDELPIIADLFNALQTDLATDDEGSGRLDQIAGYGERISAELIAAYLRSRGLNAVPIDARGMLRTDSRFTDARWLREPTLPLVRETLFPLLNRNMIPVVTGFIAADAEGRTTTLGRGGSDLTASILADCLDADLIEIWSDADGIMSADPRLIPTARQMHRLSYAEAVELSNFGGKILYSRTLVPAMQRHIPIVVRNTFNRENPGTRINGTGEANNFVVTQKKHVTAITISNPEMIAAVGYLAELFRIFREIQLSVDVVTVSEASVSVTLSALPADQLDTLRAALATLGDVTIRTEAAIVAIVSPLLADRQLFSTLLHELETAGIRPKMISYGNSAINLMLVVPEAQSDTAVQVLHEHLANLKTSREAA